MNLIIEPPRQIPFSGPYNRPVTAFLRISNVSKETQVFKIKTTAPKEYCVRPTCGTIVPDETKTICVRLQPNLNVNCDTKHKFMILSAPCPEGDFEDFKDLWSKAESLEKPQVYKLRSEFSFLEMPCMDESAKPTSPVAKPTDQSSEANDEAAAVPTDVRLEDQDVIGDLLKEKDSGFDRGAVIPVRSLEATYKSSSERNYTIEPVRSEDKSPHASRSFHLHGEKIAPLLSRFPKSDSKIASPYEEEEMKKTDSSTRLGKRFKTSEGTQISTSKLDIFTIERKLPTSQLIVGLTCLLVGIFLGKYVL